MIKDEVSSLRIRNQLLAETNAELSQKVRDNQPKRLHLPMNVRN